MRRIAIRLLLILLALLSAVLLLLMTTAGWCQTNNDAVGVVVVLENGGVATLDVSFPGVATMSDINRDFQQISRWTGWYTTSPQAEKAGNMTSSHVQVREAAAVQSALNDIVLPLVAALATHGKLGIVVMGGQVTTAPVTIENQYVRVEQSGGQGVQSYQVTVKDTGFRSLDDLRRSDDTNSVATKSISTGGRVFLAWLLVIIAAVATGFAVYLVMSRMSSRR